MRPIDADALKNDLSRFYDGEVTARQLIDEQPTIGGWISVKDGLPKEHPSMFAKLYGTEKWRSGLWRTESDRVLVTIKFPDNTCTVDKGRLQDGTWRTGVSPMLPQEVTHWVVWPEPAEEEETP